MLATGSRLSRCTYIKKEGEVAREENYTWDPTFLVVTFPTVSYRWNGIMAVSDGLSAELMAAQSDPSGGTFDEGDERAIRGVEGSRTEPSRLFAETEPQETPAWFQEVRALSLRLVEAQRPLRILQTLRWSAEVDRELFHSKGERLPKVTAADYPPLGFVVSERIREFEEIAQDCERQLGATHPIGKILRETALDFRGAIELLDARGTERFYDLSRALYGSVQGDTLGGASLVSICERLDSKLHLQPASKPSEERVIEAEQAAQLLSERFRAYFGHHAVQVQLDRTLAADAAAGSDYVKLRANAKFTLREVDILEVHEGWVHIATSLHGLAQPFALWLARSAPRTTALQEGLAALMEVVSFRASPQRIRRLMERVLAIDLAERGASFLDVLRWFQERTASFEEAFNNTRRVFRGGTLHTAPFTKDACYARGLMHNLAFIQAAAEQRRPELIPLLFVGKVTHEDVIALAQVDVDFPGFLTPAEHIPPMFRDPEGLLVWFTVGSWMQEATLRPLVDDYAARMQS